MHRQSASLYTQLEQAVKTGGSNLTFFLRHTCTLHNTLPPHTQVHIHKCALNVVEQKFTCRKHVTEAEHIKSCTKCTTKCTTHIGLCTETPEHTVLHTATHTQHTASDLYTNTLHVTRSPLTNPDMSKSCQRHVVKR